jgi:hypothetical protein
MRQWFQFNLQQVIHKEPLYSFCNQGKDPLAGKRDRFGEWLRWEWIPATGETESEKKKRLQHNKKKKNKNQE